jgi:hypothetical protein
VLAFGEQIAFSRTGDPNLGEFQDAVVLFSAGEPSEVAAVSESFDRATS